MFHPYHLNDDLLFNIEPSMLILEQDLNIDHTLLNSQEFVPQSSKKKQISSKSVPKKRKLDEAKKENDDLRKTMHRDIERQRRQEMSTLYASLRELLPLEYIKGKRSVSDHMHEAVNYVKDMEKKIEELKIRRDKLKNASISENRESNINFKPNFVTVNCCCDGFEILINCGMKDGYGFALSRIHVILIQTGLEIISCICNKVNGRFLYNIHTEVKTLAYIDLCELQQRLANVIN